MFHIIIQCLHCQFIRRRHNELVKIDYDEEYPCIIGPDRQAVAWGLGRPDTVMLTMTSKNNHIVI